MRTSTVLYLLTGLVATKSMAQRIPRVDPVLGDICCSKDGVADPSETCTKQLGKNQQKLNSFCCTNFRADAPHGEGAKGGCDQLADFPIGRLVQSFVGNGQQCLSGSTGGFIGCA
ncbi:hypothetical protein PspLS_00223 [Pyricularia sp. CBS 133598]|nr:hypothetical protein PspLS_00223 [Pyricularia sp. CBS 133598]